MKDDVEARVEVKWWNDLSKILKKYEESKKVCL